MKPVPHRNTRPFVSLEASRLQAALVHYHRKRLQQAIEGQAKARLQMDGPYILE